MSTKIYDAFKFKGSLSDLKQVLIKLKKECRIKDLETLKIHAKRSVFSCVGYDDKILNRFINKSFLNEEEKKTIKEKKLGELSWMDIMHLIEVIGDSRKVENLNFTKNVMVYPYKKSSFVVQFFGIPNDFLVKLEKKDNRFVDYHYQNQTDPYWESNNYKKKYAPSPEKIKQLKRDWNDRRKFYDELDEDGLCIPEEVGFTYKFINYSILYFITNEFKKWYKTIEKDDDNYKQVHNAEEEIYKLAEQNEELKECYLGEIYDQNVNKELYLLYKEILPTGLVDEINKIADGQNIKIHFETLENKNNISKLTPFERGYASSIDQILSFKNYYLKEKDKESK